MSSTTKNWIRSPLWDSFWILGALPLAAIIYFGVKVVTDPLFLIPYILLSSAHIVTPIVSAWQHADFKKMMLTNKSKYIYVPVAAPFIAAFIGYLASMQTPEFLKLNIIVPIFYAYVLWNTYHFAAQNFGLLTIYRMKTGNQKARDTDWYFAMGLGLVVIPIGWSLISFGGFLLWADFTKHFPKIPDATKVVIQNGIILVSLAATAGMLIKEFLSEKNNCIARYLLIVNMGIQPAMMFWSFPAFLGLFGFTHFFTSIGLASHLLANHKTSRKGKVTWNGSIYFFSGLFLCLTLWPGVYLNYQTFQAENVSNGFMTFGTVSTFLFCIAGFRFGMGLVHFLYDRYIYQFRDKRVSSTIGADLMKTDAEVIAKLVQTNPENSEVPKSA